MRRLAYPVTVSSSAPIPETDRLDITKMEGNAWQVVTERGSFKPGDRAIYFEIDSALPIDDSRYDFLKERCLRSWCDKHGRKLKQAIRIRTIKLRGVLSQGLLMPINLFEEARWRKDGEDCTEILRVQHYDDIAEEMAAILDTRTAPGTCKRHGNFPAFVPKSDEERIQNLADYPMRYRDTLFEVTVKDDGCSATYIYSPSNSPEHPFLVCSRNFIIEEDMESIYWRMERKYDIEGKLKHIFDLYGEELAMQGEITGPGVNGNHDMLTEHRFRVFRMFDIGRQETVGTEECVLYCKMIDIPHVPVLHEKFPLFRECPTIEDVLKYAEGKTENGNEREGLVFKEVGTAKPVHFKAVSNRYLLMLK